MNLDETQRASQAQFDRQSDRYGRSHVLANVSDLDAAAAGLNFPAEGAALDVATGGGHTALWLARHGWRVTLTDVSERMLANAVQLLAEEGFSCEARQHPAEALPYEDASFQVVTCRVAAHHFSDPAAFVRESARVLEPGGAFLVVDGTAPDELPEAEEWIHRVEKLRDPSHGRFLTPLRWRELCEAAGLTVQRCEVGRLTQPDLEWYFETAATRPENREQVRVLVKEASPSVREYFRLREEGGRTVWEWPRLQLAARKA